jgi:transglutaminase-like putative cysteine protease
MHYAIQHITKFKYSVASYESVMEVRLQPRTDNRQQCLSFHLYLRPAARVYPLQDYLGNWIHFFDIAGAHKELSVTANSVVSLLPPLTLPAALPLTSWAAADQLTHTGAEWEWLQPSAMTPAPPALLALADEFQVNRQVDPLTALHQINDRLHTHFVYDTESTRVDSPIDEPLEHRSGVCQDFSHIMLALVRHILKLPCRYVSGYLFHGGDDRSADDATHAWIEVLLPELGWVGFDPTNNLITGERHIRVAIGRDYTDVPPTLGIFRGGAESELSVAVKVRRANAPIPVEEVDPAPRWRYEAAPLPVDEGLSEQQQQQQ